MELQATNNILCELEKLNTKDLNELVNNIYKFYKKYIVSNKIIYTTLDISSKLIAVFVEITSFYTVRNLFFDNNNLSEYISLFLSGLLLFLLNEINKISLDELKQIKEILIKLENMNSKDLINLIENIKYDKTNDKITVNLVDIEENPILTK